MLLKANREDLIVCFYNLYVSCTGSVLTTITIDPLFHTGYVRLTGRHARGLSSLYFLSQSASLSVSMEAQPYTALGCHLRGRQQGETAGRDMDSNCTALCCVKSICIIVFSIDNCPFNILCYDSNNFFHCFLVTLISSMAVLLLKALSCHS